MQIDNSRQMATAKFLYWLVDIFGFTAWIGTLLTGLVNYEPLLSVPGMVMGAIWLYYKIQEKREDIRKKRLENDRYEKQG